MAGTMAVGLLAGCSGGKEPEPKAESEGGATTIKFGIHVANPQEQEAVTYNIVQAFNEKYDGKYKVEFEASDKEYEAGSFRRNTSADLLAGCQRGSGIQRLRRTDGLIGFLIRKFRYPDSTWRHGKCISG